MVAGSFSGLCDALAHIHENELLNHGMYASVKLIEVAKKERRRVFFIGNGGSAAIASHMAEDFLKSAGVMSQAFNDAALITCLSNDIGYKHVFSYPLELLANKGDLLFAISSSGASPNILNAVLAAKAKEMTVVTLSGFFPDNPLRSMGDINFYVPSEKYGIVEVAHLAILHAILDRIVETT